MGYATRYSLTINGADCGVLSDIHAAMVRMDGPACAFGLDADDEPSAEYGDNGEPCKWYEHEGDMRVISAEFPGVLFTLHGKGEEAEDLWYMYFRDGKAQTAEARITYDAFDPARLS